MRLIRYVRKYGNVWVFSFFTSFPSLLLLVESEKYIAADVTERARKKPPLSAYRQRKIAGGYTKIWVTRKNMGERKNMGKLPGKIKKSEDFFLRFFYF